MPIEAWFLALASAGLFGLGLVITQFGFRNLTPALGAVFCMPTAALVFWAAAPFIADFGGWDTRAALLFAFVGIFFPGAITLLTFEANRLMGPYVSGALGNLAPMFAVAAAVLFLGEVLGWEQWAAIAVIVGGVSAISFQRHWQDRDWRRWVLIIPLGAALCRGLAPPVLKIGFAWWPNPYVAILICYAVSATVAISVALWRTRGGERRVTWIGAFWFSVVGLCNGFATLFFVMALALGPVSLVSPIVAAYPVFTLVFGGLLLRRTGIAANQVIGVLLTVAGVILLISAG